MPTTEHETPDALGDWPPEQFEAYGHDVLRMIREHFEQIRDVPVSRHVPADELLAMFAGQPPERPESFADILDDTTRLVVPNLTHWNHPSFHAYFSISASFPGILAELLSAALNVNAMVWESAPAASALETVVLGWLADMVGYPADADGVLVNGASLATMYALAAARDAALADLRVREEGMGGVGAGAIRVYASDQAHSSVDKAAIALGVGTRNVVRLPSDEAYRMRPGLLDRAIRDDLSAGLRPVAVVATVGTTTTAAIDPLAEISSVCREHGVWLHTDAAYGGFWRLAPNLAGVVPDLSVADSVVVNPHKCLYAPMEVTALYCRRRDALADTFRLVPEYLRTESGDAATDFMDRSLQLGRSFRALKVWWIVRSYGMAGLRERMARAVQLARQLCDLVDEDPQWGRPARSDLPLVCLRYQPDWLRRIRETDPDGFRKRMGELNERVLTIVNRSGKAFVSRGELRDGSTIRVSIGNIRTTGEDVDRLWRTLREAAATAEAEEESDPAQVGT
jgi:aromatic-L-amino-acid/L-tryptophan decarboxylase